MLAWEHLRSGTLLLQPLLPLLVGALSALMLEPLLRPSLAPAAVVATLSCHPQQMQQQQQLQVAWGCLLRRQQMLLSCWVSHSNSTHPSMHKRAPLRS